MSIIALVDLDGTIIDSEYKIATFTADIAQAKGCPIDPRTAFRLYSGVSFKDKFNMIGGVYDRPFSADEMAAMHKDYTARKKAMYSSAVIPTIPGAVSLLRRLSKNKDLTLALTSSNETCRSKMVLNTINLAGCFADRVYGSDLTGGLKKPHPAIHKLGMNGHGHPTMALEDSVVGVVAAKAAGVDFIVAYLDPRLKCGDDQQRRQEYRDAGADIIIDSYNDFEDVVAAQWIKFPGRHTISVHGFKNTGPG